MERCEAPGISHVTCLIHQDAYTVSNRDEKKSRWLLAESVPRS
jgi:hypothetical protein